MLTFGLSKNHPGAAQSTLLLAALFGASKQVAAQCIGDSALEALFLPEGATSLPLEGSCCQQDVCGIKCPASVGKATKGYGISLAIFVALSFVVGVATIFFVKNKTENFFVAGRSLPIWILAFTLGAQAVDSNAILSTSDLAYKLHFYDGACICIGAALSLTMNAAFLAHKVHADKVMTLPDVYAKRFGRIVEVLVSLYTIVSFIFLLAGNLQGLGILINYVWDIERDTAIWLGSAIVWTYTVSGGLFSVAYTDIMQGVIGWTGCFVTAVYIVRTGKLKAPPPSIGFAGYTYPDRMGENGICDMYNGVPCVNDSSLCCYNTELWCPSVDNCRVDNGAYPFGDESVVARQMFDAEALSPFPNSILWNWATIFILGFGNLAAIDFQQRSMAAQTGFGARVANALAACLCLVIGIPIAYIGSIMRVHYGPDSVHATFEADSCSGPLGLPTCGLWVPEQDAFIKLLINQVPPFLGAWCIVGIASASMSTADGAILAMGTVWANNIVRQIELWFPRIASDANLLLSARLSTVPFCLAATLIAAYYKKSSAYLLIVAFDVVLATAVVPLFGAYYSKKPSPVAALLSILVGGLSRIFMEFTIPKDGFLLLPFQSDEFLNYGPAASAKLSTVYDSPDVWDPTTEECDQAHYKDYTGVDSLAAFLLSIFVYLCVQYLEHCLGRPLFTFPGGTPYEKPYPGSSDDDSGGKKVAKDVTVTRNKVDVKFEGGLAPVQEVAPARMALHQDHTQEPKSELFA